MAVIFIDGRGSGYDGNNLRFAVNRKLGKYEIDDQINGINMICEDHKYKELLDCSKLSIMGWSYGGYASAMTISRDDSPFQCGISLG
jgi:dipeptidyl aminopeptidase/acylaminoacyl peptidase